MGRTRRVCGMNVGTAAALMMMLLALTLTPYGNASRLHGAAERHARRLREDANGEGDSRSNNSSDSGSGKLPDMIGDFNYTEALAAGGAYDQARCGTWHHKYAELHRRILAGQAPQRYMVAHGYLGMADMVVGAVSVFYMALFTNRAFQMIPHNPPGTFIEWEWLWAQPWINWTASEAEDPQGVHFQLDPNVKINNGETKPSCLDRTRYGAENFPGGQGEWKHRDRAECGNWSDIFPEARTIKITTNFGYSAGMFNNPYYRDRLFQMGLRPDTAFSCAFNFLMYPHRQLFEEHRAEHKALLTAGRLKVGIQIRVGDSGFEDHSLTLLKYQPFFSCAEQIEREYVRRGQPVMWYFITDSADVRRMAQEAYGEKLVVSDPNVTTVHTLWAVENTAGLRSVAMDYWLFGLTDFQVISRWSGFGRSGGFRSSTGWHQLYTLNNHDPQLRDCLANTYDSMRNLAALGDGVDIGDWHPGL